jgi:L-iditol 2-dehydrogenase
MGLLQAALARAWGVASVLVSGVTPQRLAFARGVADVVVDARTEDLAAAVAAWAPAGPDAVLVSVASVPLAEQAIALAAKGGVVNVFAGMPKGETLALDLRRVHYDEVRVVGSFGYGPEDFREAFELLAAGALPLDGFVTDRVPLEGVEDALKRGAAHEGIKTVVVG